MDDVLRTALTTPAALEARLTAFTDELAFGDEDPADVVARHHTPDFEQRSDEVRFDCAKLAAHAGPLRRNLESARFAVHELVADGPRLAARYTLHGRLRKGRVTQTEIAMFAELAPDGRFRRIDQLTRDASPGAVR